MRKQDQITLIGIIIGLGATVAAMALPFAYPNLPLAVWRILFWGGLAITALSVLLLIYDRGIWPFHKKETTNKKLLVEGLSKELESIAEVERLDNQSVKISINKLSQWKDRASRLIFELFGQNEANNFNEKRKFIEKIDEYHNPAVGGMGAFLNEKNLYLSYLTDLMNDIDK